MKTAAAKLGFMASPVFYSLCFCARAVFLSKLHKIDLRKACQRLHEIVVGVGKWKHGEGSF